MATAMTQLEKNVKYNQAPMPTYLSSNFAVDDVDNHDFIADSRGKGRASLIIDNESDVAVTVSVYGTHVSTTDIGGRGVVQIGASFAISATSQGYRTIADPFPFYIIRMVGGGGPGDGSTCTAYLNISAF